MVDAVLVGMDSGDDDLATTPGNTTTGSTFVLALSFIASATVAGIVDPFENDWTLIDLETSGSQSLALYRCENGIGGENHSVSIDFTGSSFGTAYLIEVLGAAAASFDKTNSATDGESPFTVDLPTLDQANEVILTIVGNESGGTIIYNSSNTTIIGTESDGNAYFTSAVSKAIVASTAAFTPSFTSDGSGTHVLVSASFKAATGPAKSLPPLYRRPNMGALLQL